MNHLGPLLSALLDGELSPEAAGRGDAHLLSCEECRTELVATRQIRDLVRQLPMLDWASIASGMAARPLRPVAAMAAVAAVALVGVVAWQPTRSATPPVTRLVHARTVAAFTGNSLATIPPAAVNAPFQAPATLPGGYNASGCTASTATSAPSTQAALLRSSCSNRRRNSIATPSRPGDSWCRSAGGRASPTRGPAARPYLAAGRTTYTVMGDGAADDVVAAAGALPGPRAMSAAQRARQLCRSVVEAFSGLW